MIGRLLIGGETNIAGSISMKIILLKIAPSIRSLFGLLLLCLLFAGYRVAVAAITGGPCYSSVIMGSPSLSAPSQQGTIDQIFKLVSEGRRDAGIQELEHREGLNVVAFRRAQEIANLPHLHRRLIGGQQSIQLLRQAGIGVYRRAVEYIDMKKGYANPATVFEISWKNNLQTWQTAMDPAMDAIGLGIAYADDGWIILVAIILEDQETPNAPAALEERTLEQINAIRREHGLLELEVMQPLVEAARSHSEDMVRLVFFGHESPSGLLPVDRVKARGVHYLRLAENITFNDAVDAVRKAVESWMNSPGHRKNILDDAYTHTGVGVAIDASTGLIYFTQLFCRPDPPNNFIFFEP